MKLIFLAIDKYLTDVSKYVMDISVIKLFLIKKIYILLYIILLISIKTSKYNIIHLFEFKS